MLRHLEMQLLCKRKVIHLKLALQLLLSQSHFQVLLLESQEYPVQK
jgi:hypothetical protein